MHALTCARDVCVNVRVRLRLLGRNASFSPSHIPTRHFIQVPFTHRRHAPASDRTTFQSSCFTSHGCVLQHCVKGGSLAVSQHTRHTSQYHAHSILSNTHSQSHTLAINRTSLSRSVSLTHRQARACFRPHHFPILLLHIARLRIATLRGGRELGCVVAHKTH